ncbi:MAG: condensation domain-containing protein, partial [Acidobacteria bacterium]|nr:condensation domain-containing protein [Acidobacteriota bacterium]
MNPDFNKMENLSPGEKRDLLTRLLKNKLKEANTFPLSFSQERIWFQEKIDGKSSVYNVPIALKFKFKLNIDVLMQSIDEIIRRHSILRTRFTTRDDGPVQVIEKPIHLPLPILDLRNLDKDEQTRQLDKQIEIDMHRPFDFEKYPLMRIVLFQLGQEEYILLIVWHHIVIDIWSLQIFFREITTLYDAFEKGLPSPLPDLSMQYADFAQRQRGNYGKKEYLVHLNYMKNLLEGAPPLLELHSDYPRPLVHSYQGAKYSFSIEKKIYQEIIKLNRETGATMFMIMFAFFSILLSRCSNQDDIVIGFPIINRDSKQLEPLIGFFGNTLVMRIDLSGNPAFKTFLGSVKKLTLDTYAHRELPFEKLVEELQPDRNLGYHPIFQVMLVLNNISYKRNEASQVDVQTEIVKMPGNAVLFDLLLKITEINEKIEVEFEYRPDLFKKETIERLSKYFMRIINSVLMFSNIRIHEIEIISEEDKKRLLYEFNNTEAEYPKDKTIHQLFEEQVLKNPDHIAVFGHGQTRTDTDNHVGADPRVCHSRNARNVSLTYRKLNEQSNHLAGLLIEEGVRLDVIVGIKMGRSVGMIIGMIGILKAGGAYLPIDPEYPQERIDFMLKDSNAAVLLTDEKESNCQLSIVNGQLSTNMNRFFQGFHHSNHRAYVIYTSGSTGHPKGVMIDHVNVVRLFFNEKFQFDFNSRDTWTIFHSFCFDFSVWEIYGALLYGGKTIVIPRL